VELMGDICCSHVQADDASNEAAKRAHEDNNSDYLTDNELVEVLAQHSEKFIDPGSTDGEKPKRNTRVSVQFIEHIISENETTDYPAVATKRSKDRKCTGFVSKKALEAVSSGLRFEEVTVAEEETYQPDSAVEPRASRAKCRKGTGFVSKDQLLGILAQTSDGEEDEDESGATSKQDEADLVAQQRRGQESSKGRQHNSTISTDQEFTRCKQRKSTGYVTKSKLRKALDRLNL